MTPPEAQILITRAPITQLEANGVQALGHAVALAQHADTVGEVADPVDRVHVQIGMATGRAEDGARPVHGRPGDRALRDGPRRPRLRARQPRGCS